MDGPGEKHVTATARPMSQSAKIAAMQNGNYELFDWRQSNQSLNQEYIEIISRFSLGLLNRSLEFVFENPIMSDLSNGHL